MKKFLHFEGLRGIAAFIVFIAHFRPTFCGDIEIRFLDYMNVTGVRSRALLENLLSIFYEGQLPVYIFWFMSAYVISIKLFDLRRNENNKYLIEAFAKRYFRLGIPVFASSFICYVLLKSDLLFNSQLSQSLGKEYSQGWLNLWFHFNPSVIHFLKTSIVEVFIPGNCNYNMVLWTMKPELIGSYLCFGMFAVIGKNNLRFAVYIITTVFLIIGGFRDTHYFYYTVFVCGLMWCDAMHSPDTGIPLKEMLRKIFNSKITPLALLTLSYGITIYSDVISPIPNSLRELFALPIKAIGFTLLVNNFDVIRKLFSTRLFTFLGKISFSLYLIHIPVLFSIGAYMYLYAGIVSEYKVLIIFLTVTAISIVLSYLFMKLFDNKAISISDKIGKYFSSFQREEKKLAN